MNECDCCGHPDADIDRTTGLYLCPDCTALLETS